MDARFQRFLLKAAEENPALPAFAANRRIPRFRNAESPPLQQAFEWEKALRVPTSSEYA
jgi:hypothetical protein